MLILGIFPSNIAIKVKVMVKLMVQVIWLSLFVTHCFFRMVSAIGAKKYANLMVFLDYLACRILMTEYVYDNGATLEGVMENLTLYEYEDENKKLMT
jgi:hypothetical protein